MNPLAPFGPFLLSSSEAEAMRAEFAPVLTGTALKKTEQVKHVIATRKKVAGIYFWILRHESTEYKIYLGKTNSLSYRLLNYICEFQPHSPNDFKLRIFHAFLVDLVPDAALDLYFATVKIEALTHSENAAISKYNPLLNNLPSPSPEAKEGLKRAFAAYYRSSFEQRLRNVAQQTRFSEPGDGARVDNGGPVAPGR
jgi:hypothetical protein